MASRKTSSAMKVKKTNTRSKGYPVEGPRKPGRSGDKVAISQRGVAASRNRKLQGSVAAAYSTGNSGKAPQVTATRDMCRVVHRELLGNVSGTATGAFVVANTFALNPGINTTFPWLSVMAQNWETYHFSKLRFCYYTRTGSTTAGSVILAPDYDAADVVPVSEQQISSFEDIQEDVPWKDISCTLRVAPMHSSGPKKFLRFGPLVANQDIKTYDVGNFNVCTVDSVATAAWGKLWVEYDVTFYTPQLQAVDFFSTVGTLFNGTALAFNDIYGLASNQSIQGGQLIAGAANILTVSNAVIGAEYYISTQVTGTVITAFTDAFGSATIKSTLFDGFNAAATLGCTVSTVTATATTFTVIYTCTAASITAIRSFVARCPSGSANF